MTSLLRACRRFPAVRTNTHAVAAFSSFSKKVVSTGTPWEDRASCARAVRVGDTIHVSGTCAQGDTIDEQTQAIFKVISKAIMKAGGRGLEDVVITRCIAADVKNEFGALGDALNE